MSSLHLSRSPFFGKLFFFRYIMVKYCFKRVSLHAFIKPFREKIPKKFNIFGKKRGVFKYHLSVYNIKKKFFALYA